MLICLTYGAEDPAGNPGEGSMIVLYLSSVSYSGHALFAWEGVIYETYIESYSSYIRLSGS